MEHESNFNLSGVLLWNLHQNASLVAMQTLLYIVFHVIDSEYNTQKTYANNINIPTIQITRTKSLSYLELYKTSLLVIIVTL